MKKRISIAVTSVLDHFDSNIYAFLAPTLAILFFPKQEFTTQLILAYGFLATSSFIRPFSAIVFGWLCLRFDEFKILKFTLIGLGFSNFAISLLPTFATAGYYAAVGLFLLRILISMFAEGEKTIANLYFFEEKKSENVIINGLIGASTILGCALASSVSVYISEHTHLWRLPFFCSGILVFYALFLRKSNFNKTKEKQVELTCAISRKNFSFSNIAFLFFASALTYATYDMSFVFLNNFVPMITDISYNQMMRANTKLLLFDMFLFLPLSFWLRGENSKKIIQICLIMLGAPCLFFFSAISNASFAFILFMRLWIIFFAVLFCIFLNVYLFELFKGKSRYLNIALIGSIGIALLGRTTTSICLILFKITNSPIAPGIYLCALATMALLFTFKKNEL